MTDIERNKSAFKKKRSNIFLQYLSFSFRILNCTMKDQKTRSCIEVLVSVNAILVAVEHVLEFQQ